MSRSKILISLFIILTLGLHAVPLLHNQGAHQTLWPFLKWDLYSRSSPPSPIEAESCRVTGATSSGDIIEVNGHSIGASVWLFDHGYVQPMEKGDAAVAAHLMSQLNLKRDDPIVRLRLQIKRYVVTDFGIATQELPDIVYPGARKIQSERIP